MGTKPPTCQGCPALKRGLGYVPGVGPVEAELALVGQGPGEQERNTGAPFFPNAPAGGMLTRWLNRAGVPRTRVWVDNLVRCWLPGGYRGGHPYGSVDPTGAMIQHCWREHVGPSLHRLGQLRLLVPVGAPSRQFFLGPKAGERYCGTPNLVELPEVQGGQV